MPSLNGSQNRFVDNAALVSEGVGGAEGRTLWVTSSNFCITLMVTTNSIGC